MESTCFFCQLTYYSTLTNNATGKITKWFLTYLEVINISVVDIQDVGEVPFNACPPCATILQNISTHILQLEEEMKNIYAIILRNCGNGGVGPLKQLKTEIISRYNSNMKPNYAKNVTSTRVQAPFAFRPPPQRLISAVPPPANPLPRHRLIAPRIMVDPNTIIIGPADPKPPQIGQNVTSTRPSAPLLNTTAPRLIAPTPFIVVDQNLRIIHPADPTPAPSVPADLELLKEETDPGEEAEVNLDDFMIHPDDYNDDMDVDPSLDPLDISSDNSNMKSNYGKNVTSTRPPAPPFANPPPRPRRIAPAPMVDPTTRIMDPAVPKVPIMILSPEQNVTSTRPPAPLFANPPPPRPIAPAPCIMIDPTGHIIRPNDNPPLRVIDPTPPIVRPAHPKPSPIMVVPVDHETIKLEPDPEPLKEETDPGEEAEVDLDDFMIHPGDKNDMDVDPFADPSFIATQARPYPPCKRGRPMKDNPYPAGWSKSFGGVKVTRANHKLYASGFQCGKCTFRHKVWKHMSHHIVEKHQPEAFKFKCSSCGILYATQELLSSHITIKHTVHSCEHCDFTATFPSHLKNHISTVHPEVPDPLKCPTCGRVLSSQLSFDQHVEKCRVSVNTDDTTVVRPTSVQTSKTTWTYLDVAMSQVDDKICCSQCDYKNPKRHTVMQHIRANHTKHLPFRCPNFVCGWPFANQTLLDEHIASSGHGPQVCDVCGKVCRSKHSLRQHVIVAHEKSKRFICTTCGKGFQHLSVCTKHESTCLAANNGKARKLNKEEKAVLAAARKSILEQKIISNSCKHCAKRIFGSLLSFSFHEEKCRLGSCTDVQTGDEVIKLGIRLIDDSVELSRVKVTEPRVISLWKCWGCNQTFHHRPMGLEHIRAERHGHSDALPPSENT